MFEAFLLLSVTVLSGEVYAQKDRGAVFRERVDPCVECRYAHEERVSDRDEYEDPQAIRGIAFDQTNVYEVFNFYEWIKKSPAELETSCPCKGTTNINKGFGFDAVSCTASQSQGGVWTEKVNCRQNIDQWAKCTKTVENAGISLSRHKDDLKKLTPKTSDEKRWKTIQWNESICFEAKLRAFKEMCLPQA